MKKRDTNITNFTRMTRILLGIFGLFILFGSVSAQESDFFLHVTPEAPAPGQSYRMDAKSFAFDIKSAYIRWTEDGQTVKEGKGITTLNFSPRALGNTATIRAFATAPTGKSYTAVLAVPFNDVDLLVAPQTYVPAFYRGAARATAGSAVEIFAVPHVFSGGTRIGNNSLNFSWSVNGRPVNEQSGAGQDQLSFVLPQSALGEVDISLEILSGNTLRTKKTIRVSMAAPEVLVYRASALTGKRALALSSFSVPAGQSFSLAAEPYFFNLASLVDAIPEWLAGGTSISIGASDNPYLLDLTSSPNTQSQTNLSVRLKDTKNIFQKTEKRLLINVQ